MSTSPASPTIINSRVLPYPRAQVFGAFQNPEILAQWWGPNGFTNTFDEFDFRPGGMWRFTMHAPTGAAFPNVSRFVEVEAPSRIVFHHEDPVHWFEMVMTYENVPADGGADANTRLTWRMTFATVEEAENLRAFITDANEQNLGRLEACLKGMG
ncbi:SRPBCC family protein [Roseimicrobium gellanilyticum]|nr:SRPBCC family protein [Roseimicrobium gellanilyticum]